ncbi:MAG: redoxin domain-containing protein [Ignavibacteria bacterium]|jgi:thiol-disulfide isomerase/thioredoxin|nr:redoxin domain-containing protein [Ignavibacteria bacterium]
MKKYILLTITLALLSYCHILADNKQMDILEKLIPDGSNAPAVSGQIYYHNSKVKFNNITAFQKALKHYKISFKNKITLLQFWQLDDKFSKLALPKLQIINTKYKKNGIQIFAINTNDFDDKLSIMEYLNNYNQTQQSFDAETNKYYENVKTDFYKPLTTPLLFADKSLKQQFGIKAFPAMFIINKQGKVHTAMVGYFNEYDTWLSEVLDDLLKPKGGKKK